MTTAAKPPFAGWLVAELLGHRRTAGYGTDEELFGARFLRLDIPTAEGSLLTQYIAPGSIYALTPVDEAAARAVALANAVRPVQHWELPRSRYEDLPRLIAEPPLEVTWPDRVEVQQGAGAWVSADREAPDVTEQIEEEEARVADLPF